MSSTTCGPRFAGTLLAGGLLLGILTGCSFSSQNVSCSSGTCTVTLSGSAAEAEILGTTLSFDGVQDGRASLTVGGTTVSCGEGESVSAGPLQVSCTGVTDDSVELTASLG